jgi:hypothetical protein
MFNLLSILFYFFAVIAMVYEAQCLVDPVRFIAAKNRIAAHDSEKNPTLTASLAVLNIMHLLYIIWAFSGLLSDQWWLFLAFILWGLLPIKKRPVGLQIDAVVSILFLMAIILNHFQFHYVPWK